VAFSEGNAEQSAEVSIGGLGLGEGLNKRVPLLDEGAELISCDVQAIEVSVAIEVLYFLNLQSHLSPGKLFLFVRITVQISQRYLENTTSQAISGNFLSSSLVAWSEGWGVDFESGWSLHLVPLLLDE